MIDLYELLQAETTALQKWDCKLMFNESPAGETCNMVNLCDHLPWQDFGRLGYPKGTSYVFPKRFLGEDGKKKLLPELKLAGILAGFHLSTVNSRSYKGNNTGVVYSATLGCIHQQVYQKSSVIKIMSRVCAQGKRGASLMQNSVAVRPCEDACGMEINSKNNNSPPSIGPF